MGGGGVTPHGVFNPGDLDLAPHLKQFEEFTGSPGKGQEEGQKGQERGEGLPGKAPPFWFFKL